MISTIQGKEGNCWVLGKRCNIHMLTLKWKTKPHNEHHEIKCHVLVLIRLWLNSSFSKQYVHHLLSLVGIRCINRAQIKKGRLRAISYRPTRSHGTSLTIFSVPTRRTGLAIRTYFSFSPPSAWDALDNINKRWIHQININGNVLDVRWCFHFR